MTLLRAGAMVFATGTQEPEPELPNSSRKRPDRGGWLDRSNKHAKNSPESVRATPLMRISFGEGSEFTFATLS